MRSHRLPAPSTSVHGGDRWCGRTGLLLAAGLRAGPVASPRRGKAAPGRLDAPPADMSPEGPERAGRLCIRRPGWSPSWPGLWGSALRTEARPGSGTDRAPERPHPPTPGDTQGPTFGTDGRRGRSHMKYRCSAPQDQPGSRAPSRPRALRGRDGPEDHPRGAATEEPSLTSHPTGTLQAPCLLVKLGSQAHAQWVCTSSHKRKQWVDWPSRGTAGPHTLCRDALPPAVHTRQRPGVPEASGSCADTEHGAQTREILPETGSAEVGGKSLI